MNKIGEFIYSAWRVHKRISGAVEANASKSRRRGGTAKHRLEAGPVQVHSEHIVGRQKVKPVVATHPQIYGVSLVLLQALDRGDGVIDSINGQHIMACAVGYIRSLAPSCY